MLAVVFVGVVVVVVVVRSCCRVVFRSVAALGMGLYPQVGGQGLAHMVWSLYTWSWSLYSWSWSLHNTVMVVVYSCPEPE